METLSAKFNIYKNYAKDLITLSIPIMAGNLANMLINVGDVIVAGRHSTLTLGAISVASAIFMTFMIAAVGLMASISPVVSNLRGERKTTKNLFRATVKYSLIIGLLFFLLVLLITQHIDKVGLTPDLYPLVVEYLKISSWGMFGGLLFVALKEFLQAYEIVVFPNIVTVVQIFLNLFLNVALVFGMWGFPELGVKGLAIASVAVRTMGGLAVFFYCLPFLKGRSKRVKTYIKELLKTGWPISFALFFEFLGFNITAVLVGKFSAMLAAAHNIIITMTSVTYMFPMSISNAIAIKVGFANGEGNILNVKRYSLAGIYLTLLFMGATALLYYFLPEFLLSLFSNDNTVISAALPVMNIVLCFLFFDGIQCACVGSLKGLKDTKPIMITMAIAYLMIGIPIGCLLAFRYNIVLVGFWTGLAFALFVACIISSSILIRKIKKIQKAK